MIKYSEQAKQSVSQSDMIVIRLCDVLYDLYALTIACIWLYSFTTDISLWYMLTLGLMFAILAMKYGFSHFMTIMILIMIFSSDPIYYDTLFLNFYSTWMLFALFIPIITSILLMIFEPCEMAGERCEKNIFSSRKIFQ